jgi:hypothetical protein
MSYALHEILEVHELAAVKSVTLTKSKTMQLLVSDPALKRIMQQDVLASTRHLQEFEKLLSEAARQEVTS